MVRSAVRACVLALAAGWASWPHIEAASADTVSFADLMRRAHAYVVQYEDHELSAVVARETYSQQLLDADGQSKDERTLLSNYLILQLPPSEDWIALRDVLEVDGGPVVDRAPRLASLLARLQERQGDRFVEIANESSRFNLGSGLYYRTVNLPTFALRFLRPSSRSSFAFTEMGDEEINGTRTVVVGYRETKGPTFSGTREGKDLPAQGRFWLDPETGAVVRSEMSLGGTRQTPPRVTIVVNYERNPALNFRVPVEMQERYDNPRRRNDDVVVALATYADFRKLDSRAFLTTGLLPGDVRPLNNRAQ